jgi:hypothetical protein
VRSPHFPVYAYVTPDNRHAWAGGWAFYCINPVHLLLECSALQACAGRFDVKSECNSIRKGRYACMEKFDLEYATAGAAASKRERESGADRDDSSEPRSVLTLTGIK